MASSGTMPKCSLVGVYTTAVHAASSSARCVVVNDGSSHTCSPRQSTLCPRLRSLPSGSYQLPINEGNLGAKLRSAVLAVLMFCPVAWGRWAWQATEIAREQPPSGLHLVLQPQAIDNSQKV